MQALSSKPSQLSCPRAQAQRGFVAMFLIILAAIVAVTAITKRVWGNADPVTTGRLETQNAMRLAKEALLVYVATHGRLPCPADVRTNNYSPTNEGTIDTTNCGGTGVSAIGLVPWKGLGLEAVKDSSNVCLWYAVSGNLKVGIAGAKRHPINADSDGAFQVRDATGALLAGNLVDTKNNAAAIIFAPNSPLTTGGITQDRSPPNNPTRTVCVLPRGNSNNQVAQQYLDSTAATIGGNPAATDNWNVPNTALNAAPVTVKTFIQGYVNGSFPLSDLNDQLAWITAEEFAKASTQYAAKTAATALTYFYQNTSVVPQYGQGIAMYPSAAATAGGACASNSTSGFLPISCAQTSAWNTYYTSGYNGDTSLPDLLQPSTGDNWGSKINYRVSSKCLSPSLNCSGAGSFLNYGSVSNLQAVITVTGRTGTTFTATSYTK